MTTEGQRSRPPGVLIVSDQPARYKNLAAGGLPGSAEIFLCGKKDNPFTAIENRSIKIVILDLADDEAWDQKLIKIVKTVDPLIEIVAVGPPLPADKAMDWIGQGATDYLIRPLQVESLSLILQRQEEKRALRRETYELEIELEKKYVFQGLVGKSPFMLDVFAQVENVARYFSTVLVTGETGSGKELVARALQALCPVRNRKLITCDCASLPENLFESELFGYVKGAFTGADRDKRGLFEEADEGIIFLDEIGEVPPVIQGKLLRVLELKQFRPLGSNLEKKVEVRVIAATNQNLEERVQNGIFREDLFHRLNKVEIHLPPLRDRTEDIPLLVRNFLARYNASFGKAIRGVSREVQKFFQIYPWPGNIRELQNSIESASIACQREFIDIIDLPKYMQRKVPTLSRKTPYYRSPTLSLQNLEKEYISHLLQSNQGNIQKTAQILNISRTSLYSKLKRYKIQNAKPADS
jgi:DNA-binding NtrC family response regulator